MSWHAWLLPFGGYGTNTEHWWAFFTLAWLSRQREGDARRFGLFPMFHYKPNSLLVFPFFWQFSRGHGHQSTWRSPLWVVTSDLNRGRHFSFFFFLAIKFESPTLRWRLLVRVRMLGGCGGRVVP